MATFAGQASLGIHLSTDAGNPNSHAYRAQAFTAPSSYEGASANAPFEVAAGAAILVKSGMWNSTAGAGTGGAVTFTVSLYLDNSATLIRAVSQTITVPSGGNSVAGADTTFYATSDGTSTGTPKAGTYRIRIRAQLTDAVAGNYDADSDGGYTRTGTPQLWDASLSRADKGYVRAGVGISTVAPSNNTLGGSLPSPFAWPDTLRLRLTADNQAHAGSSLVLNTATLNGATPVRAATATASASSTTWDDAGAISLDKTDPTTFGIKIGAPANSTLSSRPWTHFESAPTSWTLGATDGGAQTTKAVSMSRQAYLTWDGRITVSHLLQLNDNAYGTPPSSKDISPRNRLVSDLGFVAARATNARGEGVNGITWTRSLRDASSLVAEVFGDSVVTATAGGEAGWDPALGAWSSSLPGGGWTHRRTITAPSGVTGQEVTPTATMTLLAPNPAYRVICAGGAYGLTADKDHWHAGDPLLVGVALMDTVTGKLITPDSGSPKMMVGRFNQTLGRAEYLDSDLTWKHLTTTVAAYMWPLVASAGDANVFVLVFADTSGFSTEDLHLVGVVTKSSTPYSGPGSTSALDKNNRHDSYALDPVGLALAGVLSTR